MNPSAILALLGDLYGQIIQLQQREQELAARVAELERAPETEPPEREQVS